MGVERVVTPREVVGVLTKLASDTAIALGIAEQVRDDFRALQEASARMAIDCGRWTQAASGAVTKLDPTDFQPAEPLWPVVRSHHGTAWTTAATAAREALSHAVKAAAEARTWALAAGPDYGTAADTVKGYVTWLTRLDTDAGALLGKADRMRSSASAEEAVTVSGEISSWLRVNVDDIASEVTSVKDHQQRLAAIQNRYSAPYGALADGLEAVERSARHALSTAEIYARTAWTAMTG